MLEELENTRKKALRKTLLSYFVVFIIAVGLTIIFNIFMLLPFMLIFGIIIATIVSQKDVKEFKKLYKQNIVIKSFEKVCDDVEFDMKRGISRQVIANTNMMNMGDNFYSNDYVKGKYKDISFEMSDIKIEEESTDSDGNTTTYTLFKGQWYIFDFNKIFKANVQVCHKHFTNARRGYLFSKKEEKFKKVELEDVEFNKLFKVYAQNELDAFYLLTPSLIEKIKTLTNKIKGNLLFCFIDNKLHIGVSSNKDLFEASIYKKIDLDREINKTNEEISIITDFVNILSLDNDLFKN